MIKAIVLDVDGVIVGDRHGVNLPNPSQPVMDLLVQINSNNIPIILCTGKFHRAIREIILKGRFDNLHIADNGASVFNPIQNIFEVPEVISQYTIEDIFNKYNPSTHYFELYTRDGVYVKKGLRDDLVDKHSEILQERITELSDIRSVMDKDIVKIIYISKDISIHDDLKTFEGVYSKKTIHPYLNPDTLSLITSPGVSKGSGVKYVAKKLSIELKDVLGVGDANSDWDFVKLCGHKAAMGNAENDLKQRVKNEGGIVGGDVNDDGLIDILRNYSPI